MERFVCRVFQGGKVTVPCAVRELLGFVFLGWESLYVLGQ